MKHIIDMALWDRAAWSGVAFGAQGASPPLMALIFMNAAAGRDIFAGWRAAIGDDDVKGRIRIAIIEGDIPGDEPGYSVTIGPDFEHAIESEPEFFVQRVHRMNPAPGSPWLGAFKKSYQQHRRYILTWAEVRDGAVKIHVEDAIGKHDVVFRSAADVKPNDPDGSIFLQGRPSRPN